MELDISWRRMLQAALSVVATILLIVSGSTLSTALSILSIITTVYLAMIVLFGLTRRDSYGIGSHLNMDTTLGVLLIIDNGSILGTSSGSFGVSVILNFILGILLLVFIIL